MNRTPIGPSSYIATHAHSRGPKQAVPKVKDSGHNRDTARYDSQEDDVNLFEVANHRALNPGVSQGWPTPCQKASRVNSAKFTISVRREFGLIACQRQWERPAPVAASSGHVSRRARSSCRYRLRQDGGKGDDLEVVDAVEFALHGVGPARREEAGDGALLLLVGHRADRFGKKMLNGGHVAAVARRLVEPGARAGVQPVATNAKALEPVENLLDLSEREQDSTVVTNVQDVVRGACTVRC